MSKKLLLILTSLSCTIFLFNSCFTSQVFISVLQPASVSIPNTIKSISIFPVAGIPRPPGVFDSITGGLLDPDFNYNITRKGYLYGIYDVIAASPRFQKVVISDSAFSSRILSGRIGWDVLEEICVHDSTDAVLLVKKAIAFDSISNYFGNDPFHVRAGNEFNPEGGIFRRNTYSDLYLRVISHMGLAVYQPSLMAQVSTVNTTDTVEFYEEAGFRKFYSYDSVRELLYNACFYAGNNIGKQLVPIWNEKVPRTLFIGPPRKLRQAAGLVWKDRWTEAGEIWNALSENTNKRLASRASFNIALAWERDDELDQALSWASYADSLHSSQTISSYKKALESRLKERTILDTQMIRD